MSFLKAIEEGIAKAEHSERDLRAVDALFVTVNNDLRSYSKGRVELRRTLSTLKMIAQVGEVVGGKGDSTNENMKADRLSLVPDKQVSSLKEVAGWRQHISGLPCTISFEGQHYICESLDDLRSALEELFASVGFGKILTQLTSK
ncbi:hypothetical protein [Achromobacter kerstersii]